LTNDFDAWLPLIAVRRLTRTFWAREEKEPEQGGWPRTQTHHVSPAMRNVLENLVEGVYEDRPSTDEDHINGDHQFAETSGKSLANIHGYNLCRES
jgi:hypothetical protein